MTKWYGVMWEIWQFLSAGWFKTPSWFWIWLLKYFCLTGCTDFRAVKLSVSKLKNVYENLYVTKHRNISAKEGDRVAKSFSGDRSVSPLSNKLVFTKITIYLHPFISPCIGVPLRVHFSISSIHIVFHFNAQYEFLRIAV